MEIKGLWGLDLLNVWQFFPVFPSAVSPGRREEIEGRDRIPWTERAVMPAIISRQVPSEHLHALSSCIDLMIMNFNLP